MTKARLPNFFIIGAPKCGTTALYRYLSNHPAVFMPSMKEPHYFASDLAGYPRIRDLNSYLAVFSGAPLSSVIGEASVWYLFSNVAVRAIMKAQPRARMIAMLRNPVTMAASLHQQQVISLTEDILDFEQAWEAQYDRAQGRRIPVHCTAPQLIQYGHICSFAGQIERVLMAVPRDQLLILIFEEFFADPARHYARVLEFLGLPPDEKVVFERVNVAGAPRYPAMHRLVTRPPAALRPAYVLLRRLSQAFGLGLGRVAMRLMDVRPRERPALSPRTRETLEAYFASDIARLESLLGRSLDIWRHGSGHADGESRRAT